MRFRVSVSGDLARHLASMDIRYRPLCLALLAERGLRAEQSVVGNTVLLEQPASERSAARDKQNKGGGGDMDWIKEIDLGVNPKR